MTQTPHIVYLILYASIRSFYSFRICLSFSRWSLKSLELPDSRKSNLDRQPVTLYQFAEGMEWFTTLKEPFHRSQVNQWWKNPHEIPPMSQNKCPNFHKTPHCMRKSWDIWSLKHINYTSNMPKCCNSKRLVGAILINSINVVMQRLHRDLRDGHTESLSLQQVQKNHHLVGGFNPPEKY